MVFHAATRRGLRFYTHTDLTRHSQLTVRDASSLDCLWTPHTQTKIR